MKRLFNVPSEKKLRKFLRNDRPTPKRSRTLPNVFAQEEAANADWPPALTVGRVESLLGVIEKLGGLTTQGIFRVSGQSTKINEVVFNMASGDVGKMPVDSGDVHNVSGALKQYLNMQDVPLCTYAEYENFLAVGVNEDDAEELSGSTADKLREILSRLPPLHVEVMKMLCEFMRKISSEEAQAVTCMDPCNCGICFGPVFFRPQEFTAEYVFNVGKQANLVQVMVMYCEDLFGPPQASSPVAEATPEPSAAPSDSLPSAEDTSEPLEVSSTSVVEEKAETVGSESEASVEKAEESEERPLSPTADGQISLNMSFASTSGADEKAAMAELEQELGADAVLEEAPEEVEAVKLAAEPVAEKGDKSEKHDFKKHSFHIFEPVTCRFCGKLIWGLRPRGYVCGNCDNPYHKSCKKKAEKAVCQGSKLRDAALGEPVTVGSMAPNFTLIDHNNKEFDLHRLFKGGFNVVLFFYPKCCVVENKLFRDYFKIFLYANFKVIGVSSDSGACQNRFAEKYNLPFQLLSDKDQTIRTLYGVPGLFNGMAPARVTYIISNTGQVKYMHSTTVHPEEHIIYSLKAISGLLIENNYSFE